MYSPPPERVSRYPARTETDLSSLLHGTCECITLPSADRDRFIFVASRNLRVYHVTQRGQRQIYLRCFTEPASVSRYPARTETDLSSSLHGTCECITLPSADRDRFIFVASRNLRVYHVTQRGQRQIYLRCFTEPASVSRYPAQTETDLSSSLHGTCECITLPSADRDRFIFVASRNLRVYHVTQRGQRQIYLRRFTEPASVHESWQLKFCQLLSYMYR